ncbi:Tigger transposable element-derived protein 6-like protein [Temnothorax longispinosus]|uniref:Tigger transposable element-derived protein 6-like protein n=1 Tax=Temnothorax longispinosus TaxID=300112 RepID=A0A4S2JCC4_9HYME|nr:Tigger transposable element-derived protein 6-like protein [Temnothorax longispinosus]
MGKIRKEKNKAKTVHKKTYTQEDVNNALKEVEKGMSTRKAANMFQVPRSTLYAKHKELIPVEGVRGPSTYLTTEEEKLLVDWIFYCNQRGFPVTKSQLLQCVQKLVTELKRETPFKDNKPGRHWWESFCRRHLDVTPRIAQNLTINRASATEDVLKNWFKEVKEHLHKLNLLDIHPSRIYNLDESAFFLVPKADRVLARKGSKSVYKVVHGDEKESLTVLFIVNAEGIMLPPMILFWYERTPAAVTNSLPPGWIAGNTERGWMTADSFYNYITTKFHPWLVKNNIQFPVLLYVDGHASHLTLALSQFCKTNQIELIALYPNATHILQPLDVAVFHPLKSKWKKAVDQWRIDHGAVKLKRENFAPVLKQALDSMPNLRNIIEHGFRTCGLSPFSSDAVDFNILNKKKKKNTESSEHVDQDLADRSSEQEEAKKHLKYFEHRLSSDDLQDFKNALSNGSLKISNSDNEGLFKYWLDMKRLSGATINN